jgi:hypothetical protein
MDDQRTDREGGGTLKQFSIRDLLFLVVIAALILGWWFDRRPVPARFQMQVRPDNNTVVLDTVTGQVWSSNQIDLSSPKLPK